MIRFISFLLGKTYEPCKSCQTLKEQLSFAQAEKRELLDTILNIMKPQVQPQTNIELEAVAPKTALFSRRRAAMEAADREEARILRSSTVIGKKDDSIEQLEADVELFSSLGAFEDNVKES